MKRWKVCCTGLVLMAGLVPEARAQGIPAAPPVAAPPAAPGVAVTGAPAPAAAPANLWTFLCPPPDKMAACKDKFCASGLGQMINNGLAAPSTFSGGIIPQCCAVVSPLDLAKPADSAEGAAARVKADEAAAKKRREAVRYLGTVDCRYWPEAQAALILALRADRNECVRLEAAWALGHGCCCTNATIEALRLTVISGTADGNPPEPSERVKAAAQAALAHCLACFVEVVPVPEVIKNGGREKITAPEKGSKAAPDKLPNTLSSNAALPSDYYRTAAAQPREKIVAEARLAMEQTPVTTTVASASPPVAHSVADIVAYSMGGSRLPLQIGTRTVGPTVVVEKTVPAPTAPVVTTTPAPAPHKESLVDAIRNMHRPLVATKPAPAPNPVQSPPKSVVPASAPAKASSTSDVTPVSVPEASPAPAKPTGKIKTTPLIKSPPSVPAPDPVPSTKSAYPASPNNAFTQPSPDSPASPAYSPYPPMPMSQPVAPAPRTSSLGGMSPTQLLSMLRDSVQPEQREWAADCLAACDGWTNPKVVEALTAAARGDQAPMVRAACVRSLGRMEVRTIPVVSVVQSSKADCDPRVRHEAELALAKLSGDASVAVPVSTYRTR
jgi:hypothetical protein